MKELSIEQKAKAYDEALKRAGECHVDGLSLHQPVKDVLEYIFHELKESEDEKIRKWIIDDIRYNINNEPLNNSEYKKKAERAIAWLEKQGEQEPTDKVEPKFKAGDWVVTSYGKVNQVIAVDEDGDGFTLDDDTYFSGSWKDSYHLWTIQDAKDGDVLCVKYGNDEMPFIFTGKQDDVAYCALNSFGEFVLSIAEWLLKISVLPATKEQRDLLFTKMKEAGYEWDDEKKELKKIKYRVCDEDKAEMDYCFTKMMNGEKVSPKDEEYNGEDYGIDSLYHAQRILEKTLGSVDGYQTDDGILSHKCAITAVKKLYEQKPVWGEEDEDYYDAIVAKLEVTQDDTALTDNQMEFLKSLKSRVQLKQEWSEEDKERLTSCIQLLKTSDGFDTINTKWLKSLKERYTWKPSGEQIEALGVATNICLIPEKQYDELNKLYHELKKLKT